MNEFDAKAATWDESPHRRERAEKVAAAIARTVPGLAGMHALEYGCGTGLLGFALQPQLARLTLADNSAGMLAVVRAKLAAAPGANASVLELDLTAGVPEDFAPVDLVCTLLTLHHIPDVPAILAAFARLLVPGGRLCIADLDEEDGSFHGEGFSGHRGFSRAAMTALLAAAGFTRTSWEIVDVVRKAVADGTEREFPLFLAVGERAG